MIHDGPEQVIENGFVDIATAERLRQKQTVATFRARYEPEFQRLLSAAVGLKLAHRELDAAKHAAASQPTGLPISDLLDGVEREARQRLKELDDGLTVQQLAQTKAEVGDMKPADVFINGMGEAPPGSFANVEKLPATNRKKAS
jgi:hypothetical protein